MVPTDLPTNQPVNEPTNEPSILPSCFPSSQPSLSPTFKSTSRPTTQPSGGPTNQPSCLPSSDPTQQPFLLPSSQPINIPSSIPSFQPNFLPSNQPTLQPVDVPSLAPSNSPTEFPSNHPTKQPIVEPSKHPIVEPSSVPSYQPSLVPVNHPTAQPVETPTSSPSVAPSDSPTLQPAASPTFRPTMQASHVPSDSPTQTPSIKPTNDPSSQSSSTPTEQPSSNPTKQMSISPTRQPTRRPTTQPSRQPRRPTAQPSEHPSRIPSHKPSARPESVPSRSPSLQPTVTPTSTSVILESSFIIANLSSVYLDSGHKIAFVNTISSILNHKPTSEIILLNSTTTFSRKLFTTHVLIEHVRITATKSEFNFHGLNSTLFVKFLNSIIFSAVYTGAATQEFRSQLQHMKIIDATAPVIVAVVVGNSVMAPTMAPTPGVKFDSMNKSTAGKNSVDAAVVAGVLAGLIGLLCVGTPLFIYLRRESKKKKHEDQLKDQSSIAKDVHSSADSNSNNSSSLPHTGSSDTISLAETIKKQLPVSQDPMKVSKSQSCGGGSIRHSRFSKDHADQLIPVAVASDESGGTGKPTNFSSFYDLCGESTHQSEKIQLPSKFDDNFDDMFAYADMGEKSATHFDNPLKFSKLGSSSLRSSSMGTKKEKESVRAAQFGISDFYPRTGDRQTSQENEDDLKFSKFLVQYNTLSLEEMLVNNNSISLADVALVEPPDGDPNKMSGKYEIVESVGDLFKAYKNTSNISIFDIPSIFPNNIKATPKRTTSVDLPHPASDPVHLRRALSVSASSDSNDSKANVVVEGVMPHSQRFKAIKMKFETMIQKNTKTLLLTPKESKNRMVGDREVFSV
eukprot:gene34312-44320_t